MGETDKRQGTSRRAPGRRTSGRVVPAPPATSPRARLGAWFAPLAIGIGAVGLLGSGGLSAQSTEEGLTPLGVFDSGVEGGSEIVAFDPGTDQMYVTNGAMNRIDIIDVSDPDAPVFVSSVDMAPYGGGIQSVAVGDGTVAAAAKATDPTANGTVVVFQPDGTLIDSYTVGNLPDAIAFTPDGRYIVVANEAEPICTDDAESVLDVDPPGSISIIDLDGDSVATAGFTSFDGQEDALRAEGIRIFFPGSSASQDIEPEYVAISPDGATAYVTLQENNAVAVVDIATATVTDLLPLGYKDHSVDGNGLDPSNRDGAEAIATWNVLGMYMPDAIAVANLGGSDYFLTANEGDSRDYECYSEEERVKDFVLAQPPYAATDGDDANLGRLKTTSAFPTELNGSDELTQIYSYGARSFTIWSTDGTLVFDSGDDFEQMLLGTDFFNLDDTETDERSDDKGPEPEALAVGTFDGRTFAFVGLERSGGIMMYEVTNPAAPVFIDYVNTAETAPDVAQALVTGGGDISPEGIAFISAEDSPTGVPLLAVAHEVSGTTRMIQVDLQQAPPATTSTTTTTTTTTVAASTSAPTTATPTTAAPTTATPTTVTPVGTLPETGSSSSGRLVWVALLLLGSGIGAVRLARRW